jgi:hypothetical protein
VRGPVLHLLYALALTLAVLPLAVCDASPRWRYTDNDSCTSYPLTDFTIGRPLPGAQGSPTREVDFASSLGWLFVIDKRLHIGPALFLSAYLDGGWHDQAGVQVRLRFPATPSLHIDLTPGLILVDSPYPGGFAGYSMELACGYRDWISIASRLDVVDEGPHDKQTVVQLGIRMGSYPGLGLTAVGAIVGSIGYIMSRID